MQKASSLACWRVRMSRFVYTQEMIDYVRKIAWGRTNKEIVKMLNEKFNLDKTASQINSMKSNHGIRSGEKARRKGLKGGRLFTEEQEDFIKNNVKGRYNKELTEMLNEKFNTNYTVNQVKALKKRRKWNSYLTGHFEKGVESWNKGMKGLKIEGSEKGWFKKGQKPDNYRPVGSERICSQDGYILIKVQDEGRYQDRWKLKHKVVWEQNYGKIPKGKAVVFLDGDRQNTDIDNLALISRKVLAVMNQQNLFASDPEVTRAGVTLAKLLLRANQLELTGNDIEKFKRYKKMAESRGISESTFIARLNRGWTIEDAGRLPLHSSPKNRRNKNE